MVGAFVNISLCILLPIFHLWIHGFRFYSVACKPLLPLYVAGLQRLWTELPGKGAEQAGDRLPEWLPQLVPFQEVLCPLATLEEPWPRLGHVDFKLPRYQSQFCSWVTLASHQPRQASISSFGQVQTAVILYGYGPK